MVTKTYNRPPTFTFSPAFFSHQFTETHTSSVNHSRPLLFKDQGWQSINPQTNR